MPTQVVVCILGFADFKFEFVTFGRVLEVSGVPLESILGVTRGPPFGGLGVALGVHFGGQGVPLDAFGAQAVPRTALLSYVCSILSDFRAQRAPKRL